MFAVFFIYLHEERIRLRAVASIKSTLVRSKKVVVNLNNTCHNVHIIITYEQSKFLHLIPC